MRAMDAGLVVCGECHRLDHWQPQLAVQHCVRCGARLHLRRPASLARTWALLITAIILYIPANLLPIMAVNMLGKGAPATIIEGVIELGHAGMWGIAAVVFIASILVPSLKLVGMALLLRSVQRHEILPPAQRILMFRFIEWIGRWSMLDIFVIAILAALVSFGNLASVTAGTGAMAFASVVVLTMLAALSFDPRLIWDNTEAQAEHERTRESEPAEDQ